MKIRSNQNGMAAAEALLILVALVVVGFIGWFVYHSQQTANSVIRTTDQTAQTSTSKTKSTPGVLTIKEWGVEVAYANDDVLSYKLTSSSGLQVISRNLAKTYGCKDFGGGIIVREAATDPVIGSDQTVAEAYASDPSLYTKVGSYYFSFAHDQAACADNPSDASFAAQNAVSSYVQTLVPKLTAIK